MSALLSYHHLYFAGYRSGTWKVPVGQKDRSSINLLHLYDVTSPRLFQRTPAESFLMLEAVDAVGIE